MTSNLVFSSSFIALISFILFSPQIDAGDSSVPSRTTSAIFGAFFRNGTFTRANISSSLPDLCESSGETSVGAVCVFILTQDAHAIYLLVDADKKISSHYEKGLMGAVLSDKFEKAQDIIVLDSTLLSKKGTAIDFKYLPTKGATMFSNRIYPEFKDGRLMWSSVVLVLPMPALDLVSLEHISEKHDLYVAVVNKASTLGGGDEFTTFLGSSYLALSNKDIVPFTSSSQTVNLFDHKSGSFVGSMSLSQKNFDIASHDADRTDVKYRRRRDDEPEPKTPKSSCDKNLEGKIIFPLSFLILGLIILVILNVVLFSYALAHGNAPASEEGEDEAEEEKLLPNKSKSVESKPPSSHGGKSSLENIAEEGAPRKGRMSPATGRAKNRFGDSPAPAPIYKTDSTDFWEIEADTGYNEL